MVYDADNIVVASTETFFTSKILEEEEKASIFSLRE